MAFIPDSETRVPESVRTLARGESIRSVWVNGVGGVTFRVGQESDDERYVKYAATGTPESDFPREAERLAWAGLFTPVPQVLELAGDSEGSWLVTRALDGKSAVDPFWMARPEEAARALGAGLRALHDMLPVEQCPFTWNVASRLEKFEERIAGGAVPADWGFGYSRFTVDQAREMLENPPPVDKLVVCHGDACAPNTLLDRNGKFAAHVDLGALGVADRWADLAIASWSTQWNYGDGYEQFVYDGYGVEPDGERIEYYRMLWELT